MTTIMISLPPAYPPTSETTFFDTSSASSPPSNNSTKAPVDFSPPLIAMVVVVATAFLVVTYSRLISRHLLPPFLRIFRRWKRWHRRRNRLYYLPSSNGDPDYSPPFYPSPFNNPIDSFDMYSPYGLDDSVIKTIPLSVFRTKNKTTSKTSQEARDCAVCLLEFEENEYVRTLPGCCHSFHVDCIDIWLRSHANCPLCRAGIFPMESPFVPLMAARIRPSLDESSFLQQVTGSLESLSEIQMPRSTTTSASTNVSEITPCVDDVAVVINNENCNQEERFNGRDFLLKRSYSFGFERSLASERMVTEAVTASPWRYRRGSFWSKRPSPFGSLTKSRVFSFRQYRGMKSPFFRRRGFFPLSESSVRFSGSSHRSKSMTSPMFYRSSAAAAAAAAAAAFSSSRLRCGDPEALLSPDRFNRRSSKQTLQAFHG